MVYRGEGNADLVVDLVNDVYLRTTDNRELSPVGVLGNMDGSENLLQTSSMAFS